MALARIATVKKIVKAINKLASQKDKSIEDRFDMIPRSSRAKSLEQHYGRTIDLGFRFSF